MAKPTSEIATLESENNLAFALQAAPAPVYGSRLTLGFVRRRLQERAASADLRLQSRWLDVFERIDSEA